MLKIFIAAAAVFACLFSFAVLADWPAVIEVGKFSAAAEGNAFPPNWKPLTFDNVEKHTEYTLVQDEGVVVVKAQAKASGSGLVRSLRIDLKQYPIIRWRWKITDILEKADITRKQGDDVPARVLIFFEFDPAKVSLADKAKYGLARILYGAYPPHSGITYIWESKLPIGIVLANPYAEQVKMIVVESGGAKLNQWVEEERNLYADYLTHFGAEPPPTLSIAIMTDTDVTKETATAYYGDIVFKKTAP
ncbi:MAG: DUF3047 domain-containing protein [Burkholderiales bacterium]